MRLSFRTALLALFAAFLLTPDPAAAQGILTRARRAVSRGADRAADNAQRRAEDEVARQTDQAMSAAFAQVGNSLGSALGLRGSNDDLMRGVLVPTDIRFESGSSQLTSESLRSLSRFAADVASLGRTDGLRLRFEGFPEAAGRSARRLARQRADAVEAALSREVQFQIESGVASMLDGDDSQVGVQLFGAN